MIESQSISTQPPVRQAALDDAIPRPEPQTNTTFSDLWAEALEKYKERTGFDIKDKANELSQKFDSCGNDSGEALAVLEDLPVFRQPDGRSTWTKIKNSLQTVLDVVITLNDVAGEMGNFVRRRYRSALKLPAYWKFFVRHFQVLGR